MRAAAVLAAIVFPLMAHWVWGGGWLAQLGVNFGLGAGFLDGGGAATVHVLGGLSALAVVWIAGPRKGKFPKEGLSTALPGHNAVYVLFGCLLALVGWLAWNVAGAVIWLHAPLAALPVTAVNTLLSASGALAATFAVTQVRFGKPDASLCANGWLAGLVASSACAGLGDAGRRRCSSDWSRASSRRCWWNCWSWRSPSTIPRARSRFMPRGGTVGIAGRGRVRAAAGTTAGTARGHRHAARRGAAAGLPALRGCSIALFRSASTPTASAWAWTCTSWAAALIRSS